VHFPRSLFRKSSWTLIVLVAALVVAAPRVLHAEAWLVVEADSGKVLEAQNATYPWYPASVTKMMTAYVALKAVKEGRVTLDTLLTVSSVAARSSRRDRESRAPQRAGRPTHSRPPTALASSRH